MLPIQQTGIVDANLRRIGVSALLLRAWGRDNGGVIRPRSKKVCMKTKPMSGRQNMSIRRKTCRRSALVACSFPRSRTLAAPEILSIGTFESSRIVLHWTTSNVCFSCAGLTTPSLPWASGALLLPDLRSVADMEGGLFVGIRSWWRQVIDESETTVKHPVSSKDS